MKLIPNDMQADLDGRATTHCYCWKVTRQDGTIQGFTEHDLDLSFGGTTFIASSSFRSTEVSSALGLNVDNLETDGALSSDTLNAADLDQGHYDDAEIELWRVDWSDAANRVLLMRGSIGQVKRFENAFSAEIRSQSHKLNQNVGRVHSKTCDTDLGATRCGVTLSTVQSTASIDSSDSDRIFTISSLTPTHSDGYFTDGILRFTSGENSGSEYEIKKHSGSKIELWEAARKTVVASTTIQLTAGCDKFFKTCKTKFSNAANFQGFPYIPGQSTMIEYPNADDGGYDGGSLYNS